MQINEIKKEQITFITLQNRCALTLTLCTFGASIYQLLLNNESMILTPTSLFDFYNSDGYFGKTIGRFAGRIDHAQCMIHHKLYQLDKNWNQINALHGGNHGLSFQNFTYQIQKEKEFVDVIFQWLDAENQLPGNVKFQIIYRIFENKNDFTILFHAISDQDTLINLTNHTYFNLSGDAKRTILDEKLQLFCNQYSKLNDDLIPVSIEKVNEVMDFQKAHHIKDFIHDDSLISHIANGYDHCFIKKNQQDPLIAILEDEESKRKLTIETSYPAIVCYTCNYPKDFAFNASKIHIKKHHAICFECQYVPNGINFHHKSIHNGLLKANEKYKHYIHYHFD